MKKNKYPHDISALADELIKARKIAVLGVGSELMQDDRAGVDVTLFLEKKYGVEHPRVRFFTGYSTPENFTKDIKDFSPDHMVIIDAADVQVAPGTFINLPVERITDFSLGTHKISLVMMIRFLKDTINPKFSVIAIQYKSILFGEKMTREMKVSVKKVCTFLSDIIDNL